MNGKARPAFGDMPWETLRKRVDKIEAYLDGRQIEKETNMALNFSKMDAAIADLTKAVNNAVGKIAALEVKVAELGSAGDGDQSKLDSAADQVEDSADKLGTIDTGASEGGIK